MPIKMSSDAIQQVSSTSYAAAALRPSNSRLDTARLRERFGIELPPWQDGVDRVLEALARA
jgi:dTDP-4-dehydrorhamnose reductase